MPKISPPTLKDVLGTNPKMCFGGALSVGKRKSKRVLAHNRHTHLVMRSPMARGKRSFLLFSAKIKKIVYEQAEKQNISISDFSNSGNSIHILLRIHSRSTHCAFAAFARSTAGLVARLVLGAERSSAKLKNAQEFWPIRPFTRILSIKKNEKQAIKTLFNKRTNSLDKFTEQFFLIKLQKALNPPGYI